VCPAIFHYLGKKYRKSGRVRTRNQGGKRVFVKMGPGWADEKKMKMGGWGENIL
jgi:hypothetical protein